MARYRRQPFRMLVLATHHLHAPTGKPDRCREFESWPADDGPAIPMAGGQRDRLSWQYGRLS
jgi:hypothetical protein